MANLKPQEVEVLVEQIASSALHYISNIQGEAQRLIDDVRLAATATADLDTRTSIVAAATVAMVSDVTVDYASSGSSLFLMFGGQQFPMGNVDFPKGRYRLVFFALPLEGKP